MTTLVLLHAFPLPARMWDDVLPALRDGRDSPDVSDVIALELPGFGGLPVLPGPPSIDTYADAVADELDRRGLGRVVLCGLSMGGYVAMAFARRHPDRLEALVLADTKASEDPAAARENRERIARTILEERTPRVLLDDVLPGLLGATTKAERPQVVQRVQRLIETADPEGVAWAQRAMAGRSGSFDTLRRLGVPVLVVVGDEDGLSPPSDADAMLTALPDARLAVVPRAGHLTPVEDPAAFATAVQEFLRPGPASA